ncbi:hypothetical protein BJY01DRAFT_244916 [Aspergillus pseudoustus]|uniref:Uncharacterized protein n=1 Tax=Aspergillus pseudoustus TaxID=1810923 RepID=A0ABR4KHR1_9EURO
MASYEEIPLEYLEVLEGVAPDNESLLHERNNDPSDEIHNTASPVDSSPASGVLTFPLYTATPSAISYPSQDNCYHSTVSRQWRIDEYETCESCGNRPHLRWFYLCTEDTSGYSDAADPNGSFLSPWITDAILAGEYTDAQREILFEQKLRVVEMCVRERRQAQAEPPSEHQDKPGHSSRGLNPSVPQTNTRPARCSYRACHHCDRRLQERTWLSINAICDDPNIKPPSAWDLWETPVSDARIVSNLGLRGPPPPPPPPHISQYVYRGVHRGRVQHVSENYSADYDSSSDLSDLLSRLSTIEEISEEMEITTETT